MCAKCAMRYIFYWKRVPIGIVQKLPDMLDICLKPISGISVTSADH